MSSASCDNNECVAWITSRVVIVFAFALMGTVSNGLVLKIYMFSKGAKPQTGSQLYIVALAWIDLLGCLVILPQATFAERQLMPRIPFVALNTFAKQAYLYVQVAMTFDRLLAVFRPHQFHRMRCRTNIVVGAVFAVQQLVIQATVVLRPYYNVNLIGLVVYIPSFALALTFMLVSYPAIAINLYRQSRRIQQAPATATSQHHVSESQERAKYHVKTLKIYVAILVLYLFSSVPSLLVLASDYDDDADYRWVGYLYYINNIGNPVIYYAFNDKFRQEVKTLLRSMFRCRS